MTNLEGLCEGLRAIRRPDLAQELEAWPEAEWGRLRDAGGFLDPQATRQFVSWRQLLLNLFLWEGTSQGQGFWLDIALLLLREEQLKGEDDAGDDV